MSKQKDVDQKSITSQVDLLIRFKNTASVDSYKYCDFCGCYGNKFTDELFGLSFCSEKCKHFYYEF